MKSACRSFHFFTLFLVVAVLATPLRAETLAGKVVGVTDGDTITVLLSTNQQRDIRLAGIDAPEHGQAFSIESTKHLSELVSGKSVSLDCGNEQSYGRLVCRVLLPSGEDTDLDQVKAGLAWHYKQYQDTQTSEDQSRYGAAEDAAREAHLGLWSDPHPIQPWDFRHRTQTRLCFDPPEHRILCTYDGPVRGNQRSHIYHWPGCPNYDDIAEYNRVEFPNRQTAEAAGYRAARNCP